MNRITDLTRAVARLDRNADIGPNDIVPGDHDQDHGWSGERIISVLADDLAEQLAHSVRLQKVTTHDVSVILASHGATSFTIRLHARELARRVRALSHSHGRFGAWL